MLYYSVEDSHKAERHLLVVVKQYDREFQKPGDQHPGEHRPPPITHPPTATTTYKPHGYGMITVTVLVQTIVLGQSKFNSWPVSM